MRPLVSLISLGRRGRRRNWGADVRSGSRSFGDGEQIPEIARRRFRAQKATFESHRKTFSAVEIKAEIRDDGDHPKFHDCRHGYGYGNYGKPEDQVSGAAAPPFVSARPPLPGRSLNPGRASLSAVAQKGRDVVCPAVEHRCYSDST
jgi:hypothetical protein